MCNSFNHRFEYIFVNPNMIKTDPTYQRQITQSRVNQIVKDFKHDVLNEPKVSKRSDGFYYVFDGDHSVTVHKQIYGENTPILCKVFYGLTVEEEKDLFLQQNGFARPVSSCDKIRAMYNTGDKSVIDMVSCAKICGIDVAIDRSSCFAGDKKIIAIEAAYAVYKDIGHDGFINVLTVIKKAWDAESTALTRGFLKGLGYIYKRFGSMVTNEKLINALKKYSPDFYIRNANELHGSVANKYARTFVKIYNYKKSTGKLPEDF